MLHLPNLFTKKQTKNKNEVLWCDRTTLAIWLRQANPLLALASHLANLLIVQISILPQNTILFCTSSLLINCFYLNVLWGLVGGVACAAKAAAPGL